MERQTTTDEHGDAEDRDWILTFRSVGDLAVF